MKIYQINKNRARRAERRVMPVEVSGLKKAAGGEDIISLSEEAINSFKRDNSVKNREQELVKLAQQHINDYSPEIENIENDLEFRKAEKLSLLAELVIRVAVPGKNRNIYGHIADFVVEQMAEQKDLN